jgi:predicted nucleic acid-binding protein
LAGLAPLALAAPPIVVVDTDVVSFLFKKDTRAVRYEPHLLGKVRVLSAQARAEFHIWPNERAWGEQRRQQLEQFLSHYLVEYPNERICRIYGEMVADARKRGFQVPEGDAWHAATALSLDVPLVTHNERNYRGIQNLQVITEPGP